MATAMRVPQDGKYERVHAVIERTCDINYRENGVIIKNYPIPSATERVESSQSKYVPQPDRVRLDLSLEEALTLSIIAYSTGGHPLGRRGDVDSINRALRSVGVSFDGGCSDHPDILQPLRFTDGRIPNAAGTSVSPDAGTSPSKAQDVYNRGTDPCGGSTATYR